MFSIVIISFLTVCSSAVLNELSEIPIEEFGHKEKLAYIELKNRFIVKLVTEKLSENKGPNDQEDETTLTLKTDQISPDNSRVGNTFMEKANRINKELRNRNEIIGSESINLLETQAIPDLVITLYRLLNLKAKKEVDELIAKNKKLEEQLKSFKQSHINERNRSKHFELDLKTVRDIINIRKLVAQKPCKIIMNDK
jgi:hypothetical protein